MSSIERTLILISLFSLAVTVTSCDKNSDNTSDQTLGWAAGKAHDGFATIFHTTDGGITWERQGDSLMIPDANLQDIRAIDKNNVWACGEPEGGYPVILRTKDGGKTWIRQGVGSGLPDVSASGISPVNINICWISADQGTVMKTTDGGNTWANQKPSADYSGAYQMIAAADENHVWTVGEGDTVAMIHYTSDGGHTWERQGTDSLTTNNMPNALIDIHAVSSSYAWAVGPSQIIYTGDGGHTWVNKPNGIGFNHNNGVCIAYNTKELPDEDKVVIWVATDYNMIFKLSGLYNDWIKQPGIDGALSAMYMGVSAMDENKVWITTNSFTGKGQILHTQDGGETWVIQDIPYEVSLRRITFAGGKR
jgi:photosystem II stability/assembly factor-like uncharacterized protein